MQGGQLYLAFHFCKGSLVKHLGVGIWYAWRRDKWHNDTRYKDIQDNATLQNDVHQDATHYFDTEHNHFNDP